MSRRASSPVESIAVTPRRRITSASSMSTPVPELHVRLLGHAPHERERRQHHADADRDRQVDEHGERARW
jgi:hypothetical protein